MQFLNSLTRPNSLRSIILGVAVISVAATLLHAKKPPSGGDTEPVLYAVLPQPDYEISDELLEDSRDGLLIRGAKVDGELVGIEFLIGRADSNSIVISNPAVAAQLPMLIGWSDDDGYVYTDQNSPTMLHGGPLVIDAATKRNPLATAVFFFGGFNRIGDRQMHRLDAIVDISGPGDQDGAQFPHGIDPGQVYTIRMHDWYVSHDTGSGKNAYRGPVLDSDGDPMGDTIIELLRVQ